MCKAPAGRNFGSRVIHFLSQPQRGDISTIISSLRDFDGLWDSISTIISSPRDLQIPRMGGLPVRSGGHEGSRTKSTEDTKVWFRFTPLGVDSLYDSADRQNEKPTYSNKNRKNQNNKDQRLNNKA